jgi:hypothetical protein
MIISAVPECYRITRKVLFKVASLSMHTRCIRLAYTFLHEIHQKPHSIPGMQDYMQADLASNGRCWDDFLGVTF